MQETEIERAKRIIEKLFYITIASVSKDGSPWNTPVFSAYDKNYNFYWGSHRNSQHSKNVRDTGNIFLVLYDSTMPAGTGEGVYIKAKAVEIENSDKIAFAHNLLQTRRDPIPYWKLEQVKDNGPIRLYKAVPEKMWVNGDDKVDGNYIDVRVEVDLFK